MLIGYILVDCLNSSVSLFRTKRLPVLYVFGREEIDINDLIAQFQSLYPQPHTPILILYDVTYSHVTGKYYNQLSHGAVLVSIPF